MLDRFWALVHQVDAEEFMLQDITCYMTFTTSNLEGGVLLHRLEVVHETSHLLNQVRIGFFHSFNLVSIGVHID